VDEFQHSAASPVEVVVVGALLVELDAGLDAIVDVIFGGGAFGIPSVGDHVGDHVGTGCCVGVGVLPSILWTNIGV